MFAQATPSPRPGTSSMSHSITLDHVFLLILRLYVRRIVVGQLVGRSTQTTEDVGSSLHGVFVRFCFCCVFFFLFVFSFAFSLFLDFIDSSAFPLFLFLIGLRFVNYILLEISKSGHYTRLYVAYIIKSCNPYPYHKAFSVAIVKIVL